MRTLLLPKDIARVVVPPIKCQGIKTKLVPFIATSVQWDGEGRWIEPFLGSGVVLFNMQPRKALVADTNRHIIEFYQEIQKGTIDEVIVKQYLEGMGDQLLEKGAEFFYEIRERFNQEGGGPLEMLFLNRSCFNGVMRFNSKGYYNVPFGHKPQRFRQAYITKITNQVKQIRQVIQDRDWEFRVSDWKDTLAAVKKNDFVYMDPPYTGRHTDYYNSWTEEDAVGLSQVAKSMPCGFALSMWQENKYRKNEHIDLCWDNLEIRTHSHFYHVGSTESLRNKMEEALIIKPGFAMPLAPEEVSADEVVQLGMALSA